VTAAGTRKRRAAKSIRTTRNAARRSLATRSKAFPQDSMKASGNGGFFIGPGSKASSGRQIFRTSDAPERGTPTKV
jgi:hypothetical protein